jgi:hypothetical protein
MSSDSEPVLLVRVFDPIEAEIIVAKLRSAGINTYVRHEALSVVYGLTVDGAGQQDIFVRGEDLEEAKAALERSLEDTDEPDEPGPAAESGSRTDGE